VSTPRLSRATLGALAPVYDLDRVEIGVAHLGPGAFHRAHQAWYFDRLLAHDPRWAVAAIAPRRSEIRDALAPQDGLYVLAELDKTISYRVIGALRALHVAAEDIDGTLQRLVAPTTRLVTLTVTEKGYCLDAQGELDLTHPAIRQDIAMPHAPRTAVGWLTLALARRRAAGTSPFIVLSCDNLADNGGKLKRAVLRLAGTRDVDLARWIEDEVRFPASMVDSITPATTDALRQQVRQATGLDDAWPIQRESFVQWVVEDALGSGAPDLASVGVTLTKDVGAFERAKLRLLNAAHSTLAYAGTLRGHGTVAEAMQDSALAGFVRDLMRAEIAPTLEPPAGLDLDAYIEAILARFRNPAIRHELAQIAWDGSQKLPVRVLDTLCEARQQGRAFDRLAMPLAAWMRFIRQCAKTGVAITDPLADRLVAIGSACIGDAAHDVARFLALDVVFPADLAHDTQIRTALERAYARLP
jgi:fructuronate reductase